jgi:BlaI family transcriptional regulator, penicillinase repressor
MSEPITKGPSPRRAVLDLAPLELDCMNTLWPMGEGTVREIRERLAERRPRAYTTIMTIMDRLARKGVVERRRSGRAYIYRPNLSCEDARAQALNQIVENFFGGSREALLAELGAVSAVAMPRARAAAAGAAGAATNATGSVAARGGLEVVPPKPVPAEPLKMHVLTNEDFRDAEAEAAERIDDTLL